MAPFFTAGTQHVLVGHSLGSLVARGLYVNNSGLRPLITGIVTVAAPHQGAPFADNAETARRFFADVQRRVNGGLAAAQMAFWIQAFFAPAGLQPLYVTIAAIVVDKTSGQQINLDNVTQLTKVPVLPELQTSSQVIASLNGNVADAAIPHANVYGTIPLRDAVYRLKVAMENNDAGFNDAVNKRKQGLGLFKVCKYMGYGTIVGAGAARRCAYAAKVINRVDDRWALYANGADAYGRPKQVAFDGIVPNERSRYPATTRLMFDQHVPGINHMNIYKTRAGLDQVAAGMRKMGMESVTPPPPPPGIPVSISGPSTVALCGGTWFATPSGGTAPYTYTWRVGTQSFNTGSSNQLDYAPSSYGTFSIQATATDAQGNSGTGSKSVTASTGGMC